MIKGIDVILLEKRKIGNDPFGKAIYQKNKLK